MYNPFFNQHQSLIASVSEAQSLLPPIDVISIINGVGSIPVCPVLIDALQPGSFAGSKCWPPHQDPQNTPSYNGCNTLAVHEVHEVKEEEPASTEVVAGSQWVKWLPHPLLVEHKGQVREREQHKIRREKEKRNKRKK